MRHIVIRIFAIVLGIFAPGMQGAAQEENSPEFSIFIIRFCPDVPDCPSYIRAMNKTGEIIADQLRELLPSAERVVRGPEEFDEQGEYWTEIQDRWAVKKFNRLIAVRAVAYDKSQSKPTQVSLQAWTLGQDFLQKPGLDDLGQAAFSTTFDLFGDTPDPNQVRRFIHNQHRNRHALFGTKRVNVGCIFVREDGEDGDLDLRLSLSDLIDGLKLDASKEWKDMELFQRIAELEGEGLSGYSFVRSNQDVNRLRGCAERLKLSGETDHYLIEGILQPVDRNAEDAANVNAGPSSEIEILVRINRVDTQEERSRFPVKFAFEPDPFAEYEGVIGQISCTIARKWLTADRSAAEGQPDITVTCRQQ